MMPEGFEIEFTPVSDRPADIAPEEAARYLSPDEEASYRALKAPKRRREWLAGRLSAKILLARKLAETGHRVAPPDILIEAGEGGAPSWRTRRRPFVRRTAGSAF